MIHTIVSLYKLLTTLPPAAYDAVGEILESIQNHDDPRTMARHAGVLAAKAKLGLHVGGQ